MNKTKDYELSIIIPVYNEEDNLDRVEKELSGSCSRATSINIFCGALFMISTISSVILTACSTARLVLGEIYISSNLDFILLSKA